MLLLLITLLVSLTPSSAVSMAEWEGQFGNYKHIVDITKAQGIFDEEARRLGVTTQEHFNACKEPSIPLILYYKGKTAMAAQYLFSDFEAIKQESVFLRKRKYSSAAEMVETAKTDAPKSYAAVTQLVRNYRTKYVEKLDEPAKTFANQLVDAYIQLEWSAISTVSQNERMAKLGIISNRMWQPILLILLVSLTHSTLVKIEDIQSQYRNYKNLFNISRAQIVFDEVAKRLGITPLEHFSACKEPSHPLIMWWIGNPIRSFAFMMSEQNFLTIDSEGPRYSGLKNINTTEEFIEFMKKVAPKSYDIVNKCVFSFKVNYLDNLDESFRKFMDQLGETTVESLVTKCKELLDKCINAYKALSQSSKENIDKLFCTRTVLRLFEVEGDCSEWINVVKNTPTY